MGICNLRHVNDEIAKRQKVAERYMEHLDGTDGLQLNRIQKSVTPNYAYFPVVFEEKEFGATRTEVYDKLAEKGVSARKYFYPLTNTFSAFHGKYDVLETPVALHISKRVLTLPIYADLALEDVDSICETIMSFRRRQLFGVLQGKGAWINGHDEDEQKTLRSV
jgi:dTDP-4-amino-4,6-dideoxygalactose transaminase